MSLQRREMTTGGPHKKKYDDDFFEVNHLLLFSVVQARKGDAQKRDSKAQFRFCFTLLVCLLNNDEYALDGNDEL